MSYRQIFDCEGDGSQDAGTLLSLSGEFLEAAKVLQATPPVRVGYSSVTYYLFGHAAELMLKAFLYKTGQTLKDLREFNHDLKALATRAIECGLPERTQLTQILSLADMYTQKSFEYRTKKRKLFPSLEALADEVGTLQSVVSDRVSE